MSCFRSSLVSNPILRLHKVETVHGFVPQSISVFQSWCKCIIVLRCLTYLVTAFRRLVEGREFCAITSDCVSSIPVQAKRVRGEALPRAFVERAQRRLEAEVQVAQHTELPGQPPNSVHGIAREVGCHPATLYRYFPGLCKVVAERYVLYLRKRSMARDEALRHQVTAVVLKLLAEGEYPSSVRVSHAPDKPGKMRDPVAQRAWRMALKEADVAVPDRKRGREN